MKNQLEPFKRESDFSISEKYGQYLKCNKQALKQRIKEVKIAHERVDSEPCSVNCETCGHDEQRSDTGYCFQCNTDNWELKRF